MEDIQIVFESMSSTGSIFISNYEAAQNLALLQNKGIKAVLSVARSGLLSHKRDDIHHYLYLPVEDHEDFQISKHFDLTYDFIEKARKETNVLIHCMVGVSRSVTIAIAYLLKKYKYTLSQVITLIQRKRRKINPNSGFLEQLRKYSQQLGIKCDFHGNEVPPVRESSTSKHRQAHSAKKQRTPIKIVEPLTPVLHIDKDTPKQRAAQNHVYFIEELKNSSLKRQGLELKKFKSFEEKAKPNEEEDATTRKGLIDLKEKFELKKSYSINEGREQKRSSIQEKISKIREKILKTQQNPSHAPLHLKRESSKLSQRIEQLQKPLKSHLKQSLHEQPHQDRSKLASKPQITHRRTNDYLNYCKEQRNKELFNTQLRIQSKTFYSNGFRPNSRFSVRPKDENHH